MSDETELNVNIIIHFNCCRIFSATFKPIPLTLANDSAFCFLIFSTEPNSLSSINFVLKPIPFTPSNSLFKVRDDLLFRWKVIANRCASSLIEINNLRADEEMAVQVNLRILVYKYRRRDAICVKKGFHERDEKKRVRRGVIRLKRCLT